MVPSPLVSDSFNSFLLRLVVLVCNVSHIVRVHFIQNALRALNEGGKLRLADGSVTVGIRFLQQLLELIRKLRGISRLLSELLQKRIPNLGLVQLSILIRIQFIVHLVELLPRQHAFLLLSIQSHFSKSNSKEHPRSAHRYRQRNTEQVLEP